MPMTFAAVDAFATSLPDVTVGARWNNRTWTINDNGFAWERPLSKADLARYGDEPPPTGALLAVSTDGLDAKDALLAMDLPGFFTIAHFNNYPAVLIELRKARIKDVKAAIRAAHAVAAAKPRKKKRG